MADERLRPLTDTELEVPPLAPDVAAEILSPDDRSADVDDKIGAYLRGGSSLVIIVDPQRRVVELHDRACIATLNENEAIEHSAPRPSPFVPRLARDDTLSVTRTPLGVTLSGTSNGSGP